MKKIVKTSAAAALFGFFCIGAASCASGGNDHGAIDFDFWHNFGGTYSTMLKETIIEPYWRDHNVNVEPTPESGYPNLQKKINYTLADGSYPNMATGYPDHFAGYIASEALVPLDDYIKAYDEEHANDEGYIPLLKDFYSEYMEENVQFDKAGHIYGIPFNKSTEVLGYNGVFMDYMATYKDGIYKDYHYTGPKFPKTWEDWEDFGPKAREVQLSLCGKYLLGKLKDDNVGYDFIVADEKPDDVSTILLDFSKVDPKQSTVLSWDSADNMFITIVRQWGSKYTSSEFKTVGGNETRKGYVEFQTGELSDPTSNLSKTCDALNYFAKLFQDNCVFALPTFFDGESYASGPFAGNQVLFTICSSGGLSYNINGKQRFRIAPIPYKSDDAKYVISQGANICVFDRKSPNEERFDYKASLKAATEAIFTFATGQYQADWAQSTGYYPASRSATNTKSYQEFIKADKPTTETEDWNAVAFREGSKINADEYMNDELANKWFKFVDPGFDGSSTIRDRVATLVSTVYNDKNSVGNKEVIAGHVNKLVDDYLSKYKH